MITKQIDEANTPIPEPIKAEEKPQPEKTLVEDKQGVEKKVGKYEAKARELADKILKAELPSWMKADLPEGTQKQGFDGTELKKLLADATVKMGKLLDTGVEFAEAVKQAVKDIVDKLGESNRERIEEGFAEEYRAKLNDVSGIKKALVSEEIIKGVDLEKIGDKEMMVLGRKILDTGEVKPEALVTKIITEGKGVLTPTEVVGLITYKRDIDNSVQDAYKKYNEKLNAGDDTGTLGVEIANLERQINDFDVMAIITAQQQSMAFRLRQRMLDREYNVVTQIERYKKNNSGYIPPEVEAKFRDLDKQLKEVKAKLAEAEKKAEQKEGQESVDNIKESVDREKKYTDEEIDKKVQQGVDSELNKIYEQLPAEKKRAGDKAIAALQKFRAKLKNKTYESTLGIPVAIADLGAVTAIRAIKVGRTIAEAVEMGINRIKKALKEKGFDKWGKEADYRKDLTETLEADGVSLKQVKDKPIINEDGTVKIPNEMLRDLVKRGITDINDLTDAVHEQVVKTLPDITKREVRDYITKYGKEVNPTADTIQTQINTAKRVGKLLSELEDLKTMGKVEFLAKYQKPKPSDNKITEREKELKQQIKSLSKDIVGVEDVDKVGKDAEEKHRKRIEDLEKELERVQLRKSKEKKEPNKTEKTIPEDEQKILDEIEAEQTKWDEEKDAARQLAKDYQKMETERNRQLARVGELNDAIKILEGGNLPQGETKIPKKDTPEIEALKTEKAQLEKKVRESIAHENKMKELDKELQRLKDRKAKEPKPDSKRIIGQDERLKRDEIEAERKAWDIENNIEKLNAELQRVRDRQKKVTDPKEKRELTDTEKNILQEIKDEKAVWAKEVEPERRVREALKSAQKSLEDYERRIAEKDFSKKDIIETPLTPELKTLREKRDAKRKEYEKLKKDTVPKIPKTDAEILKAAKERARARIEQLTTKLKNKDFAKPVKKIVVPDNELQDLEVKKIALQEEFDKEQEKIKLKNRTWWQKGEDYALEIVSGIPRLLVAGLDFSAPFVQGTRWVFTNLHRPKVLGAGFAEMFRQFASQKRVENWQNKLKTEKYYPLLQASKLAISDHSGQVSVKEGLFIINWGNQIYDFAAKIIGLGNTPVTRFIQRANPLKASSRAFDGFINYIRVQRFMQYANQLDKAGYTFESNPEVFKSLGDWTNTTTGRGSLGALETSSKALNVIFFAARKVASEIKLYTPYAFVYYAKMPPAVRRKALLEYATFITTFVAFNAAIRVAKKALSEDDDEDDDFWNMDSSNFMTHKFGNQTVGFGGGAKTSLVFMSRLWGTRFTDQYGKDTKLGDRYGKMINTKFDLIVRFAAGKASPGLSAAISKLDERKGLEVDDKELITNLTIPIWLQDAGEVYKTNPAEIGTLFNILSIMGANVRTVEPKKQGKSITIKDPETFKKRDVTEKEQKKYEETKDKGYGSLMSDYEKEKQTIWVDINDDIHIPNEDNFDKGKPKNLTVEEFDTWKEIKYSKLTPEQKKQLEGKAKRRSSAEAKKELFGVDEDE